MRAEPMSLGAKYALRISTAVEARAAPLPPRSMATATAISGSV